MTALAISEREQLLTLLLTGPIVRSDAIVCLCGEDAAPRVATAKQLFAQSAAPGIVLTGGKHDGERWTGAAALRSDLLGYGVAPDRILVDDAMNTREQAVNIVALARTKGWTRLLVVASAYHLPRAFLTFVKALDDAGQSDTLRVTMLAAPDVWTRSPAGMTTPRKDLLAEEWDKLDRYADHVASAERGIDYLLSWEPKP